MGRVNVGGGICGGDDWGRLWGMIALLLLGLVALIAVGGGDCYSLILLFDLFLTFLKHNEKEVPPLPLLVLI